MRRKIVHIGFGFCAFLLAFLPRPISIIIVLTALCIDLLAFHPGVKYGEKAFNFMAREVDRRWGLLIGPTIYILVVLFIVLVFDIRVAAFAFALLAFGDGFATVVGKKIGSHIIWKGKTIEGFIGFILFGTVFSSTAFIVVSLFQQDGRSLVAPYWFLLLPSSETLLNISVLPAVLLIITTVVGICAFLELFFGDYIDDNILVPISSSILITITLKLAILV